MAPNPVVKRTVNGGPAQAFINSGGAVACRLPQNVGPRMPESLSSVSRELFAWIDAALSTDLPERAAAFHFNLYEGTNSVHVQLIGTDSFAPGEMPERDYGPATETFTTGEQVFEIPFDVAGSDWKQWLATCLDMLRSYIATGARSDVLRSSLGVGVGFVDGDMHILWQPGLLG